jgi:hypothetical protein
VNGGFDVNSRRIDNRTVRLFEVKLIWHMKRLGQRVDVIGGYPLFDALFDIEDFIVGDRIILDLIFGNLRFWSHPRVLALFKVKQGISNFFRSDLMVTAPITNLSTCLVLYLAKALSTTLLARH